VFPFNSKRLKLSQLQQLAIALELPPRATGEDLRTIIEEKLRTLGKNPSNIQVVVDQQEGGAEKLSLQDEGGVFLNTCTRTNSPVPSLVSSCRSTPQVSPSHSIGSMKQSVEATEKHSTETQALGNEGNPEIEEDKELSQLEVKLKQQLDSFVEEIQYLKLCLGEKQSELDAVKSLLDREKSVSQELLSQNQSLQQQQQQMAEKNLKLVEELQASKDRVKQLWQTNCEQLQEFDETLSIKEEELQRARGLLQQALMASHMTGDDPRTVSMAHGTSTARPLYSTTRVSESLIWC